MTEAAAIERGYEWAHERYARLGVSTKTVRNRLSDVFAKLGASSRTEAVVLAREAGLGGAVAG